MGGGSPRPSGRSVAGRRATVVGPGPECPRRRGSGPTRAGAFSQLQQLQQLQQLPQGRCGPARTSRDQPVRAGTSRCSPPKAGGRPAPARGRGRRAAAWPRQGPAHRGRRLRGPFRPSRTFPAQGTGRRPRGTGRRRERPGRGTAAPRRSPVPPGAPAGAAQRR
ncbi:hypothetical protein EAO69_10025 [Streptomyces sp. me109]|nr:hypothetical protein EAO69_10025 [Streptomyces sp. me109]